MRQKQGPHAWTFRNPITTGFLAGLSAIEHESAAADGLLQHHPDKRRRHVHYTHVRTNNTQDVQPDQLTRAAYWDHLICCYREAYPKAEADTGSILQFGLVCKEKHKDAARFADRSEHHHAAVYCSQSHLWRRVREISAAKYNIQLNAVAHDAYCTMYNYLRVPTKKKPLFELDAAPYHSPLHPLGDELRELLKQGEKYMKVRRGGATESDDTPKVRSQFGIAYTWIISHGLREREGAVQFEIDAVAELKAGRPQLLEFAKKHRGSLEDQLDFCWSLNNAPARLLRLGKAKLELLLEAAYPDQVCANGHNNCSTTYNAILTHQRACPVEFCHLLYDALEMGRSKGSSLMLVGPRDTGKTTVTEPARLIFITMSTPQADSFCPLEDIRGHELILWQDFRYSPGHPRKAEEGLRIDEGTWNRLLEGLPTRIGVPKTEGRKDFTYKEDPTLIFTGPFELLAYRNGVVNEIETDQLTCRLRYVFFSRPASAVRQKLKNCTACWSRWVLRGELQWRTQKQRRGR